MDGASLMTVTEAHKIGVSRLVRDVEAGQDVILLRHGKPVAAVVGMARLQHWDDLTELSVRLAAVWAGENHG